MIVARCHRVRPEGLTRLESWLAALSSRRDAVSATLRAEGVTWERVYLIRGQCETFLVALSETEDAARARATYAGSTAPIDVEHRVVLRETLGEAVPIELALVATAVGDEP